jgi:hypothetical protein
VIGRADVSLHRFRTLCESLGLTVASVVRKPKPLRIFGSQLGFGDAGVGQLLGS